MNSIALAGHYEWRQDNQGRWRLWEVDKSQQVSQWYHQGSGRTRLVRDQDNHALPRFDSIEAGTAHLEQYRWGREILKTKPGKVEGGA